MNMDSVVTEITRGLEENPEAAKIRRAVFMDEQGFENEFDETDKAAYHALVRISGKAAATARLFEDEKGWHIGRVAVLKEYRKKGLGKLVMQALENKAKELGVGEISLSAQVTAKKFYENLGYSSLEDLHYDEGCPHVTMKKTF